MPRSRSRSIESRCCAVICRSLMVLVAWRRRSESVVLPWSTCAMMQKLRVRAWSDMGTDTVANLTHKGSDVFGSLRVNLLGLIPRSLLRLAFLGCPGACSGVLYFPDAC